MNAFRSEFQWVVASAIWDCSQDKETALHESHPEHISGSPSRCAYEEIFSGSFAARQLHVGGRAERSTKYP